MKKQALFLMAGALVAFASCNTATNEGTSQAQIDSTVNARVEQIRLEMMAQNDSLINEMAQMKADSILAAMKGGSSRSTTTKTKADRPQVSTSRGSETGVGTPTNSKDGRFNGQGNSNTDKKEARFSEDAAKKQQEENTKKKADRFK